nr:hypothetical protein [Lentzea guizhouensis]
MPLRRCHVSSSACDSNGSAPARSTPFATSSATSAVSTAYPIRRAGWMIAARSSSVLIGPTVT